MDSFKFLVISRLTLSKITICFLEHELLILLGKKTRKELKKQKARYISKTSKHSDIQRNIWMLQFIRINLTL